LPAKEVSLADTSHTVALVCLVCLFYPCLLMVLLRPNEGYIPPYLERVVARWPSWLRGRPVRYAETNGQPQSITARTGEHTNATG
jgi:hypothetical protein